MSTTADPRQIQQRLQSLEGHLKEENPVLLQVVQSFRQLDKVAYKMGTLPRTDSYATRVPWWPLVSILGTFSSGKSTFINHYLGVKLQLTGNQAVDDKFTVICYGADETPRTLPGLALDADPRFPFYQISTDIEEVARGEGRRVDAYLQLKTAPSEKLRGKIMIDSPGFDADAQRTSTLRITDHIIDLSDLVLVFFDARHPEPGAMHDTLEHLVADTISRPDSNKFLYILNQIDATAREDNPEEVFAAWQRALSGKGLTAGRFYRIYNPDAATPIEDESRRQRFEAKRDADMDEIHSRMHQVEVERAYRIIGVLEKRAKTLEEEVVPRVVRALDGWRRRVLWGDGVLLAIALVVLGGISLRQGWWEGLRFAPPWLETLQQNNIALWTGVAVVLVALFYVHHLVRKVAAGSMRKQLTGSIAQEDLLEAVQGAFQRSTSRWRSIFQKQPAGWGPLARKRLSRVLQDSDRYVQTLNDQFTNPSGRAGAASPGGERLAAASAPAASPAEEAEGSTADAGSAREAAR